MIVSRYRNVLGPVLNARLYRHAVASQPRYAETGPSTNTVHYPNWRNSQVLHDSAFAEFKTALLREIHDRYADVVAALGLTRSQVDGTAAVPPNPNNPVNPVHIEMQLTSHNDGGHYRIHSDNNSAPTRDRVATYVYYFQKEPKAFNGGNLLIYGGAHHNNPGEVVETIEPENDLLIFFDPSRLHEVTDVSCPSKDFADGRFTLNGWIHPLPQNEKPNQEKVLHEIHA